MTTINPWINFNGNAEEAFTFYKSVFGGEFKKMIRFKDLAGPQFPVTEKDGNKIMQIALSIDGAMLLGNDVPESMGKVNENENRSKIHVNIDTKEEAERIFNGLSAGGQVEMPFATNGPVGAYFATFRDKYGIEWIIESNPSK